jgi:cysteine desulfurase / selenocysteine lyase
MIYLDNAATTFPKPPEVYEKTFEFIKEQGGNPGRGSHYFSTAAAQMIYATRNQVAQFFRIPDSRRVIFTHNCTDSINMVLKGLLKMGDHVISTNLDHNAVTRPLEHLRKDMRLDISRVPFDKKGSVDPILLRGNIQRNTRLIILNHGSNVLGSVQPLPAFLSLSLETGIPILIDAAQTAGRIPIEIGDAPAFLAFSAHKALFGMPGLGLLTVPAGFQLQKWREGGSGTASETLHHPDELPYRLEAGTPNSLAIASLQNGLGFITREGMQKMHRHEMDLALRLHHFLVSDNRFVVYSRTELGERLPIVSFNLRKAPPDEVAAILDQNFGIAVRGGLHCAATVHAQLGTSPEGCVRISPGYFNTQNELETLILALNSIAEGYAD